MGNISWSGGGTLRLNVHKPSLDLNLNEASLYRRIISVQWLTGYLVHTKADKQTSYCLKMY